MARNAQVNARVASELKSETAKIYRELGFTLSEAINVFLVMSKLYKGFPFEVRLPGKETRDALERVKNREGLIEYENVETLIEDMEKW